MTPRLMTIGLVIVFVAAGCGSGGGSENGATPTKDTIEAFELSSSDPGSISCGDTGPQKARLYRAHDGSFAWLDNGEDGTVDGIASEGAIYLRSPEDPTSPTPSQWVEVPAGVADPLSYFAYFLTPWIGSSTIFDTSEDPLHEIQARQAKGQKSPTPIFDDDPRGGTVTWTTDDDGRVVEATFELPPEADSAVESVKLLPPTEVPDRPPVPAEAPRFADEPLANYLPRSVMINPACGEMTTAQFTAAQPCLDAAMEGQTVGEWVKAHDKQASLHLPTECA